MFLYLSASFAYPNSAPRSENTLYIHVQQIAPVPLDGTLGDKLFYRQLTVNESQMDLSRSDA